MYQCINESMDQWTNESIDQCINGPTKQWTNEPMEQFHVSMVPDRFTVPLIHGSTVSIRFTVLRPHGSRVPIRFTLFRFHGLRFHFNFSVIFRRSQFSVRFALFLYVINYGIVYVMVLFYAFPIHMVL